MFHQYGQSASNLGVADMIVLPALDNTYGALFLGMAFGLILYGLTVHQTYRYFRVYPTDPSILISLVIFLWVLETLNVVITVVSCYYHLVSNYFNPSTLSVAYWATRLLTPTSGVIYFVCQSFYARRVWYIGPAFRWLVCIAVCIMTSMMGLTIVGTVVGYRTGFLYYSQHWSWLASVLIGGAVLTDSILTGTLITVLLRSRTGFKRTDSTLEVLILYAINTGLLTTLVGLAIFIFAIILPGNLIYVGVNIVGTQLYATSVLAVLNSRRALRKRMNADIELNSVPAQPEPHTVAEMWDVPRTSLSTEPRRVASTRLSFAQPNINNDTVDATVDSLTTVDSSTASGRGNPAEDSSKLDHQTSKQGAS